MKQSLFAIAMEEAEQEEQAVAAVVTEAELPPLDATELVDGLNDIAQSSTEITVQSEDIADASTDATTLSSLADTLEAASEEGVDPTAAAILAIGTESIYKRLGVKRDTKFGMESFGTTMSRKEATRLALEDLGEGLRKIWLAIKAAFVRVGTMISRFIKSLFATTKHLTAATVKMQKEVSLLQGEPKSQIVKPKASINALMNWQNLLKHHELVMDLQHSADVVMGNKTSNEAYGSWLTKHLDLVSLATNIEAFNALPVFDFTQGYKMIKTNQDGVVFKSEQLPGNRAICVVQPIVSEKTGKAVIESLKDTRIYVAVGHAMNAGNDVKFNNAPTLTIQQMEDVLKVVLKITSAVDQGQHAVEKLEDAHAKCVLELDKILAMKDTDVDVVRRSHLLQTMVTQINRLVNESLSVALKTTLRSAVAAYDYVSVCSKQYEQKFSK